MSLPDDAPAPNTADELDQGPRRSRLSPAHLDTGAGRPAPPEYAIRDLTDAHLAQTARLHIRELPVGLFPRLGPQFVKRWHRAFIQSPHAVALSAVDIDPDGDERLAGFLVGATDHDAFVHELVGRHRNALAVRAAVALAVRPRLLGLFLRTRAGAYLRLLRRTSTGRRPRDASQNGGRVSCTAELTAIVITPDLRGTGVGNALVEEFLARCAAAGARTAELSTTSGPASAAGFYSHTGWTEAGRGATFDGQQLLRFRRGTHPEVQG